MNKTYSFPALQALQQRHGFNDTALSPPKLDHKDGIIHVPEDKINLIKKKQYNDANTFRYKLPLQSLVSLRCFDDVPFCWLWPCPLILG